MEEEIIKLLTVENGMEMALFPVDDTDKPDDKKVQFWIFPDGMSDNEKNL